MVVGKLRMKQTDEDARSNQLYKNHTARRRTRSPSIDPPPEPYGLGKNELDELPSGSSHLSRTLNKGKSKRNSSSFKADDELVIQWTTTSSNLANQLLSIPASIKSTSEFELKLKEALNVENDDLRLESLLNDDIYLPRRWRNHDGLKHHNADLNGHQLSQLESEEYEEYIRKRMWSQSNRKHYLSSKNREEEERQEEVRAQEKSKKRKVDAKLRAEREASKKVKQKLKQQQRCRDRYFGRWEILNSLINSDVGGSDKKETEMRGGESRKKSDQSFRQVIEFEEIPWPVYTSDELSLLSERGIEELNPTAIQEFLFGHVDQDNSTGSRQTQRKKIMRNALLAYHPDRFDRLVNRIKDVNHSAQKAREWGLRVSQILNELNQSIN